MQTEALTLPFTSDRTVITISDDQFTIPQLRTIDNIKSEPEFDFVCTPLHRVERTTKHGPITVVFYTKNGDVNAVRIGIKGKILKRTKSNTGFHPGML